MAESWRLLLAIVLGGAALTVLGLGVLWSLDETRRIRRSLKLVLGDKPHSLLVARGRGRGIGCNFTAGQLAVAWDSGAWCLIYRMDELVGAELIVDGRVEGRVYRGEERRAVDRLRAEQEVRLRLVFDVPRHPDFALELWTPESAGRKGALTSIEAVQEANRWLALVEAVLRRHVRRRAPATVAPAPPPVAAPEPSAFESLEDDSAAIS